MKYKSINGSLRIKDEL